MPASVNRYASEVVQAFQDELNRGPGQGDVDAWTAALAAGATDVQMRQDLAVSPESEARVGDLYQGVLGRAADAGGLATAQHILAAGGSLDTVRTDLAHSVEAGNDVIVMFELELNHGPGAGQVATVQNLLATNWTQQDARDWLATTPEAQADIGAIYQQVLGRPADPGGLAGDTQALEGGASLAAIRNATATSAEAAGAVGALYQQVLGRAVDATGLANDEALLGSGFSLAQVRAGLGASAEAANDIGGVYEQVLGRWVDASGLGSMQGVLAQGGTLAAVGSDLAGSAEAQADLGSLYQQVVGSAIDPASLASATAALAAGATLGAMRASFAQSAAAAAAIDGVYQQVLGRAVDAGSLGSIQAMLAGGTSLAQVRQSVAGSAEALAAINVLYGQVLGRGADASGLAAFQDVLAQGGNLAGVRMDLAQSAEGAAAVQSLYQAAFGRAASSDEAAGMQYALGLSISDADQFGFYKADGTVLAQTNSSNLLAQLPVAVTLDNGATPVLGLPDGSAKQFADAAQLSAAILGLSLRQGQASVGSLSAYQLTSSWLDQIDQPMLQVAANLQAEAQAARKAGNTDQVNLAGTAYGLALKIAALPPAARGGPETGMSASVKDKDGHTVDVIVYNDTSGAYGPAGHVVYHDKPADVIPGIIEQAATTILDIAAGFFPPLLPVAGVVNLAEAGQGFAEGNVLGGVLHLAEAAGFGSLAYGVDYGGGLAAVTTGKLILAATAAVGGGSSIVQGAEAGDPLAAVSGALTVAAAAASAGITVAGVNGSQQVLNLGNVQVDGATLKLSLNVTEALGLAATGTAVADALNRGDVNSALITSLGPLLSTIAATVEATINAHSEVVGEMSRTSSNNTLYKDYVTLIGSPNANTSPIYATLGPSGEYSSPAEAAAAGVESVNQQSIQENREYGGFIMIDPLTGKYYATTAYTLGQSASWGFTYERERDILQVGDYHTHGDYSSLDQNGDIVATTKNLDQFDSDNFSARGLTSDKEMTSALVAKFGLVNYNIFLGTPSGVIKQWSPTTGETTIISR